MNEQQRQTYFTEFDTLGEAKVRHMVEMKTWLPHDSYHHVAAKEWLLIQESLASVKRDAREEETLAIAKNALSSANEANRLASAANEIASREAAAASRSARYAMYAAAIAAVGAISANKTEIMLLIFG